MDYIEEGLFKKKKQKHYVQPTKEDYNKAISVAKKILFKEPLLKKAYKVIPYKIDKEYPNEVNILYYSFRDDRLPSMAGDEWYNFLDNIDSPAIVKLEEELEKYDIEMHVDGTKDGTVYIKKYTYSTNESYTPERGEIKMKSINNLASIARMNGIETTNRLRDDIVSEYTDIIGTLSTVDESVIVKDIGLLPVYKINEYTETEENIIEEGNVEEIMLKKEMEKAEKAIASGKISKIKAVKKSAERGADAKRKALENHKKLSKEEKEKAVAIHNKSVQYAGMSSNNKVDGWTEFENTIKTELAQKEKIIKMCDAKLKQLEKIKEGYAIDLDSLKYVVESKEMTLEEAIQEIRDVNYIGDTFPMYCVLPSNINENMTLESFISLNETLNKYEISPISIKVFNENEFVNESSKISNFNYKAKK